jgi:hypothetical protein
MRKRHSWLRGFLSGWVIFGGIIISLLMLFTLAIFVYLLRPTAVTEAGQAVAVTLIPAPTLTPAVVLPTLNGATPTPTGQPSDNSTIHVGGYVKITGTGGDGLRLRDAPGISSTPLFLGMDAEVFQVKDGPRLADGYTWWYLVAPYDAKRSGWAASSYLTVVVPQQ